MATATIIQPIGQWQSWIPTFTGFSADPTAVIARYTLNGKICTVSLMCSAGTSNATTFTITLPFLAKGVLVDDSIGVNNGVNVAGRVQTAASSNILTCYSSIAAAAWTASGSKLMYLTGFTYEIE